METKIAKSVFSSRGVALAYLFGSQARGRATPLSDIDFAVLFKDRIDQELYSETQIALASDLIKRLKRNDVDLVVLNSATPLMRYKVFAEGKLIYRESEIDRVRFEVKTMRDYFDTKPLREVLRDAYLKRSA